MKTALVPPHTSAIFLKGQHCTTAVEGDIVLVKHAGLMPKIIRFGQRLKYFMWRNVRRRKEYDKAFCAFNHAMVVVAGGAQAQVSQMEAKGGSIVSLETYVDEAYAVIHFTDASQEQRSSAVAFATWAKGIQYGWLSILGCAIDAVLPFVQIAIGSGNRMICSTETSLAARCEGYVPDRIDVAMMPADIARNFDVKL